MELLSKVSSPGSLPTSGALSAPLLSSHQDMYRPTRCLCPLETIPVQVCLPNQFRLLSVLLGQVAKLEVTNVGKKKKKKNGGLLLPLRSAWVPSAIP